MHFTFLFLSTLVVIHLERIHAQVQGKEGWRQQGEIRGKERESRKFLPLCYICESKTFNDTTITLRLLLYKSGVRQNIK